MKKTKAIIALLLVAALGVGALGAANAGAAQSHASKAGSRKAKKPAKGVYWGAWIGPQLTGTEAPWDMSAVSQFQGLVGKSPSLIEFSSPFRTCNGGSCEDNKFPTGAMQSIRSYGAIPVFSWGSQPNSATLNDPDFSLQNIANGSLDSYIRQFATEAKAWGHPFFLRFNWEMNGTWFLWSEGLNGNSPGSYVAAWRHVHDIFASVGANNATWVWCPYAGASGARAQLGKYYPGDEYVDWTCLDGYNWGGPNSTRPSPWRSFDWLFATAYRKVTKKIAPNKPMMLGELASNGGGKPKATWINRMFAALPKRYPRVRGLVWFNCPDRTMSWTLESSAAGLRAFSKGIQDRRYLSPRFNSLAESPIPVSR
ncbi:MAG TPA: glycosyl hydrolase [Solirubrobacterales bacterium]|nr:glycosyl hydrolase [Solirubrobacterales bacterium]